MTAMRSRGQSRDRRRRRCRSPRAARAAAAGSTRSGRAGAPAPRPRMRRALVDCGDERKPCRYSRCVTGRRRSRRLAPSRAARRAAPGPSSLACTPPKPPLLMHSTWSPGRAAATMRATSSSMCRRRRRARRAAQRLGRVPAEAAAVAERQVGLLERPGQLRLHRAELHRVRARLEDGEDACARRPCGAGRRAWCASPSGGARSRRRR